MFPLFKVFMFVLIIPIKIIAAPPLEIELNSGNKWEVQAKELLLELNKKYGLSSYQFTNKVQIQSKVIPHSHPVLTLNTRLIDKPNYFLSTYLHEQLHWYLSKNELKEKLEDFVLSMKILYPNVPYGRGSDGARSEYSTYLHLGLNLLEYDALKRFTNETIARNVFKNKRVYKWINKTVLEDYLKIKRELVLLKLNIEK